MLKNFNISSQPIDYQQKKCRDAPLARPYNLFNPNGYYFTTVMRLTLLPFSVSTLTM